MSAKERISRRLQAARPMFSDAAVHETVPVLEAQGDLADLFETNARALQADLYRARDEQTALQVFEDLVRRKGWSRAAAWAETALPVAGVHKALERAGCTLLPREEWPMSEVGITGADAGIAATGSLVLRSGPGKPRSVSLLPPAHVAFLLEPRIVPTLEDWLASEAGSLSASSGVVLVSGPSRSGDIEMVVTLGVHGPGEVHIIVIAQTLL